MKITVDTDLIEKEGFSEEEVFLLFSIVTNEDINNTLEKLKTKSIIKKTLYGYEVTQANKEKLERIILNSDETIPNDNSLEDLAEKLMSIYPKGKKEGTSTYWRGNKRDTVTRLQKFFKLYNNKYTYSQIIEATKKYVESFNGIYSYMRVLKYFIMKNERKVDADGIGYIEEVSDLATYIENMGSEDTRQDWTSTVV